MWRLFILLTNFLIMALSVCAQLSYEQKFKNLRHHKLDFGVSLTFDEATIMSHKPTKIIVYALPNGNTTAQTFGKKLATGDDWHFGIQHIGAQTQFIRSTDTSTNYVVVYAENEMKSWPTWRRTVKNSDGTIEQIIAGVYEHYRHLKPKFTLSGHSGGGSFIFGYLNAFAVIPDYLERIAFLDATYAYETEKHLQKMKIWLSKKDKHLQVFAYNDSVVVYNGKPLVSLTGGTWYRSKLMANDLGSLKHEVTNQQLIWRSPTSSTSFILLKNPDAQILHTVMVEKNGFIHALFNGTMHSQTNYQFWGNRAYEAYILGDGEGR